MENRKLQILLGFFLNMPIDSVHNRRKSRAVSSFLKKTYDILDDPENHYAVKWAHNGVGFVVTNEQEFSREILPKYFKHSNYSSFVRQLNMYNFHKIREANQQSHFHHENFRIHNRNLLSEIKRKPEKKKKKSDESEDECKSKQQLSASQKLSAQKFDSMEKINQNYQELGLIKIKSWKEGSKKVVEHTHELFASEKQQNHEISCSKQRISIQNILCQENDDDKISINNELAEMFPRCPTKEIFYPSNNNIYPFPYGAPISNFSLFF